MALETLNGIKKTKNCAIVVMDDLRAEFPEKFNESGAMDYAWFEKDIRPKNFIYLRHDNNSVSFTLQNGPIKEHGINGCQVDDILEVALLILKGFNANFSSRENAIAITKIEEALMWLEKRKQDRIERGVEGFSKA